MYPEQPSSQGTRSAHEVPRANRRKYDANKKSDAVRVIVQHVTKSTRNIIPTQFRDIESEMSHYTYSANNVSRKERTVYKNT